ncbi:MAG: hypothetical protein IT434_09370 [Phycisphaerales bacterium]|jgi:hypothetical protein|nr:hypothetical protein [Phycisphaerales bacterium]
MKLIRLHAIATAALAVWLSSVVASGFAAAITFPAMKKLGVRIPAYEAFDAEHWKIAGGKVGWAVFTASDIVQPTMALIAAVCLLLIRPRDCSPRWGAIARLFLVAAGIALFLWYAAMIRFPMEHALDSFWTALDAARYDDARKFQSDFDALHPASSRTLSAIAITVLLALLASLITAPKPPASEPTR